MTPTDTLIEVDAVVTRFGRHTLHDGVAFRIQRGSLNALIGGSGSGKTILLREMIGLHRPTGGTIRLLNTDVWRAPEQEMALLRQRFGMMFQDGALFSSLTVAQNVAVPLVEHTSTPPELIAAIVGLRLSLAGLDPDVGDKMPSQLSGGMRKRAAIARALALEPEILFLDEPTSGLDPTTARTFDSMLRSLCDSLGITVFLVTHDLDTLLTIADRILVLARGNVIADGTLDEVLAVDDPWLQSYFSARKMIATAPSPRGH